MIQSLVQQLQGVLSTKDSVETAKVCRAIVEEGVRTICQRLGKEAKPTTGLLEMLSRPEVSGFVDDAEVSQALEFVRILGANATHGRRIKKKQAEFAANATSDFLDILDVKLTGGTLPPKKAKDSEDATRRLYIDLYLGEAKWNVLEEKNVALPSSAAIEIAIDGMPNAAGKGYADYVLYDKGGRPLAVIEAKKAGVDPIRGREQLRLYGELLAKKFGYVPVLYYSSGYETWVMDGVYPDRKVVAFHTEDELQRMIQKRDRSDITNIRINPEITGRPYQITAITKMCEKFNRKERAGLLVMATGTGKTRTVVSLVDVLSRNNWITNVLFLADRTSLVEQAHDAFREHLPDYTRSVLSDANLLGSPEARIMFSTYQTMINKIDGKEKEFTAGRFDLIIVDEAHRSIFNKYRSICTYFDALLVGLTATPRGEVDRSTYAIFGCDNDVPDYDYSMQQGFDDGFLKPYKVLNRKSLILNEGITYARLSDDEKHQLDEAYDGEPPDEITPGSIFEKVYNKDTCNKVLQDLMANGLKVDGGDLIGKSVIFAYNHKHAELIVRQFNELFPEKAAGGNFCQLVDNYVNYADSLIRKFKTDPGFRIAVSVDMLDTGIDVPPILNLVFFKPVRSHIKFIQMIGRGTRCSENLFGPGKDKQHFLIFDYCGNFEFFNEHTEDAEVKTGLSVAQRIFVTRVGILVELQKAKNRTMLFDKEYHVELKQLLLESVVAIKNRSNRIQVRECLQHIDAYTEIKDWEFVSEVQAKSIVRHLAPLVEPLQDEDVLVRMFDARMLRIELSILLTEGITKKVQTDVAAVIRMATILLDKCSIPEVDALAEALQDFVNPIYWNYPSMEQIERWRRKLRSIMKYAIAPGGMGDVFVDIEDEISDGDEIGGAVDVRTYRKKVLDYLEENFELPVIKKIRGLGELTEGDLKELEDILYNKLGTPADFEDEHFSGSLVAFVRTLAGLDMTVVQERFGKYLEGNLFNSAQQEFVDAIIRYVRENGEITRTDIANAPQFMDDDPVALFGEKMPDLLEFITQIEKACPQAA